MLLLLLLCVALTATVIGQQPCLNKLNYAHLWCDDEVSYHKYSCLPGDGVWDADNLNHAEYTKLEDMPDKFSYIMTVRLTEDFRHKGQRSLCPKADSCRSPRLAICTIPLMYRHTLGDKDILDEYVQELCPFYVQLTRVNGRLNITMHAKRGERVAVAVDAHNDEGSVYEEFHRMRVTMEVVDRAKSVVVGRVWGVIKIVKFEYFTHDGIRWNHVWFDDDGAISPTTKLNVNFDTRAAQSEEEISISSGVYSYDEWEVVGMVGDAIVEDYTGGNRKVAELAKAVTFDGTPQTPYIDVCQHLLRQSKHWKERDFAIGADDYKQMLAAIETIRENCPELGYHAGRLMLTEKHVYKCLAEHSKEIFGLDWLVKFTKHGCRNAHLEAIEGDQDLAYSILESMCNAGFLEDSRSKEDELYIKMGGRHLKAMSKALLDGSPDDVKPISLSEAEVYCCVEPMIKSPSSFADGKAGWDQIKKWTSAMHVYYYKTGLSLLVNCVVRVHGEDKATRKDGVCMADRCALKEAANEKRWLNTIYEEACGKAEMVTTLAQKPLLPNSTQPQHKVEHSGAGVLIVGVVVVVALLMAVGGVYFMKTRDKDGTPTSMGDVEKDDMTTSPQGEAPQVNMATTVDPVDEMPDPDGMPMPMPDPAGMPMPDPDGMPMPDPAGIPMPDPDGMPMPDPAGMPMPDPVDEMPAEWAMEEADGQPQQEEAGDDPPED